MGYCRMVVFALMHGLAGTLRAQTPSPTSVGRLPETYLLRGTVRDSGTGAPVSGARIWPWLKGWGAVSDKQGRYELRWRGRASETFLIRTCDDRNVAQIYVDFFRDSVLDRDITLVPPYRSVCASTERLPWAVDSRDTTRFIGYYIYSWEGGGWLKACGGATYTPDWDSVLGQKLRQRQEREGQISFVRFQGRVARDGLGDDPGPGMVMMGYDGPIYLVSTVEEVRDARPDDCR